MTLREIKFISGLLAGVPASEQLVASLRTALVEELEDGGMGSLRFYHADGRIRSFGRELLDQVTVDSDGVPISVTVNVDEFGDLYELDVWKVDFSPTKRKLGKD
jgi:hypothetical protein